MRKFTILCAFLSLAFIAFAQNDEAGVIKKSIQAKMDAYRGRDKEGWKASWQHDATTSFTFLSNGGYNSIKGWDSLEATIDRDFKRNSKPDSTVKELKLDNFSVQTGGNLATVVYDMTIIPVTDESSIFPYTGGTLRYHNYEVLVKENGQWKTNTRIITLPDSYTNNNHATETGLNNAGYDLLAANKVNEAIEVFKLNVKLFPESFNTYDSLGEALALAGNKKEAISNYEKSVKLNPNSASGKEALVKLKQK